MAQDPAPAASLSVHLFSQTPGTSVCFYVCMEVVDLFTGLREGELLGLMWDCIDFDKGTTLVDKQLRGDQNKGGQYYLSPPKNNKSRTLTPAPYVMKLPRTQKVRQAQQRPLAGPAWDDSGFVFTNEVGRYISYRATYENFKRIVSQIVTVVEQMFPLAVLGMYTDEQPRK